VAIVGDAVVGYANADIEDDPTVVLPETEGECCWMRGPFIESGESQGIGQPLAERRLRWMRELNRLVRPVALVAHGNSRSEGFHTRQGFEYVGNHWLAYRLDSDYTMEYAPLPSIIGFSVLEMGQAALYKNMNNSDSFTDALKHAHDAPVGGDPA
jgi:hypothetical protein